ncbi:Hypothetical protein DHA2_150841 [Giardia duodenalis]|uniref:Uncharacterized protein n=1 Tax=Giardia intestinalis TaxID=5741 RepID=V6TEW8_GIAIN|nr:Hypothetical protein DHA2_150841 [Giardia intestinalis]
MSAEPADYPHNIGVSERVFQEYIDCTKKNDALKFITITNQANLPLSKYKKHSLDEYMAIEETQLTISYFCHRSLVEGAQITVDEINLEGEASSYLCFRNSRTSMEIYFPIISTSTLTVILLQKLTVYGLGSQLEQAIKQHVNDRIISKLYSYFCMGQNDSLNAPKKYGSICNFFFNIVRQCLRINPVGPCLYCGSPIYGLPGRVSAATGDIHSDIAIAVNLNFPLELFGSDTLEKYYPSLESSLPSRLYAFTEIGDSGAYTLPFYTHPTLVLCDNFVDLMNVVYAEQGDFVPVVKSKYNTFTDDDAAMDLVTYELTKTKSGLSVELKGEQTNIPRPSHSTSLFYPYHNACADTIRAVHDRINKDAVLGENTEELKERVSSMNTYYTKVIREVRDKLKVFAAQNRTGA